MECGWSADGVRMECGWSADRARMGLAYVTLWCPCTLLTCTGTVCAPAPRAREHEYSPYFNPL
jgi:hypothetical protein